MTGVERQRSSSSPGDGAITEWTGMNDAALVARGEERVYETPLLSAGLYTFTMTHDPAHAGGDADLYVRMGQRPHDQHLRLSSV